MDNKMTEISQAMYDEATSELLTVQDAVEYLEKEGKMRTLREKLEKYSYGRDLQSVLTEGLMVNHPELSRDSVRKRVKGWLTSDSRSLEKPDAIEVCFILKLSLKEADDLVASIAEEKLHWRSPDEIVYIFALKQGMDYPSARALDGEMRAMLDGAKDAREPAEDSFTPIIRQEVYALNSKEELRDYLRQAAPRLGRCHNTAYRLFMEMMDTLKNPQLDEETARAEVMEAERLTIRDILQEYFYENNVLYAKEMVRESKKKNSRLGENEKRIFTAIEKNISDSWPDEAALSKMKSRKLDVTRKVLILLFLATEPGPDPDGEEEFTRDEVFQDLYQRLNDMLALCGFAALDPRVPFDWMILYCICVQDMFDVDARMRAMFREMFGERLWTAE